MKKGFSLGKGLLFQPDNSSYLMSKESLESIEIIFGKIKLCGLLNCHQSRNIEKWINEFDKKIRIWQNERTILNKALIKECKSKEEKKFKIE